MLSATCIRAPARVADLNDAPFDINRATQTADRICNFNRHYAEFAGYWTTTNFLKEVMA